ncbi:hypothetical protein JG687_00017564 [Phytophthora cactorum]|uniref:Uncharacterized protein n=1 Tax=Phytophthora cactorum TaxID=29920 RepID=A0A8T1TNZ4_9STRA|nr:hypothetical protein JG687_00017564 [Phytophthora cactorum]
MVASGSLSPEIKPFRRSRNSLESGWGEVLQQHLKNVFLFYRVLCNELTRSSYR